MGEIRVDQSHCNHHLTKWLEAEGWQVVFNDGGRASRGGRGTQGDFLRIFEKHALPIPDIVAIRGETMLIIEVDTALSKALGTLERQAAAKSLMLSQVRTLPGWASVTQVVYGFCRTGVAKFPDEALGRVLGAGPMLSFAAVFDGPGSVSTRTTSGTPAE